MSTPSRFRFSSLLALLAIVALVGQQSARAAILSRAIEVQKSLVEREEQALREAKDQVYRTAQNAMDVSRDAVSNVADQLRYVVRYPWRVASEAMEKPKLYAKYMLSKAGSYMNAGDEPTPVPVVLTNENTPQESSPDSDMLPQLMSSLRSLFNPEPTETNSNLHKPSPLIEVIEIKATPVVESVPQVPSLEQNVAPTKEVILI